MLSFSSIFLIISGFFALLRTWLYYNYLCVSENKEPIGIIKYIDIDNNIIVNYWKILPITEKSKNDRAKRYKRAINVIVGLFYLSLFLFVRLLISKEAFN